MQTAHYRNAMGILLVYDVTNEQSFKNIEDWLKNIDKHTTQPVNKILIGEFSCRVCVCIYVHVGGSQALCGKMLSAPCHTRIML